MTGTADTASGQRPAQNVAVRTYLDPVWKIKVEVRPVEAFLLTTPEMRRLHFIAHAGASRIVTQQTYTRLEHSLGVFALTASWYPDEAALRVAALVHDIGHLPFSHTAEGLAGLDHHRIGLAALRRLSPELTRYGLRHEEIAELLSADAGTALVAPSGTLSIDHLDSYVRSACCEGRMPIEPKSLLDELEPRPDGVSSSSRAAAILVDLICEEARLHTSWSNIAPASVLRDCVNTLLHAGCAAGELAALTDDGLWALLERTPATATVARRLREQPQLLTMRAVAADDPRRSYGLRRIYRSAPLLDGRTLAEAAPDLAARLTALDALPRDYHVSWS